VGGRPANISPLPESARTCEECKTNLTFLTQVYANVPELPNYHRILSLFACLSHKCIGSQCVRAFREVLPDENEFLRICTDEEYDAIAYKTDDQLIRTSKWVKEVE